MNNTLQVFERSQIVTVNDPASFYNGRNAMVIHVWPLHGLLTVAIGAIEFVIRMNHATKVAAS